MSAATRPAPAAHGRFTRTGWILFAVMAVVSLAIQSQVMSTNHKADAFSQRIQAITNDYAGVMADHDRLQQLNLNIRGLDILAAERFLSSSVSPGTLTNVPEDCSPAMTSAACDRGKADSIQ